MLRGGEHTSVRLCVARWPLLTLAVLLVTIRPHPDWIPHVAAVYLGDLLLAVLMTLYWLIRGDSLRVSRAATEFVLVSAFALVLLCASLLAAVYFDGGDGQQAVVNVLRFSYYFFAFCFFLVTLGQNGGPDARWLLRLVDLSFAFNVVIAAFQLLDPPALGDLVTGLFGSDKLRTVWTGYPRVYGAFFNANWFGAYLTFCATGWFALFSIGGMTQRALLGRGLLLFALLLFSGSRTGMIGLATGLAVLLVRQPRPVTRGALLLLGSGGVLVLFSLNWLTVALGRTLGRFTEIGGATGQAALLSVSSLSGRLDAWRFGFDAFLKRPFYGYGDAGLGEGFIPHNSLLALVLTLGIVGTLAVLGWLAYGAVLIRRGKRRISRDEVAAHWFWGFTAGLAVMSLAADFVYTTQVGLLWVLVFSVAFSADRSVTAIGAYRWRRTAQHSRAGETLNA